MARDIKLCVNIPHLYIQEPALETRPRYWLLWGFPRFALILPGKMRDGTSAGSPPLPSKYFLFHHLRYAYWLHRVTNHKIYYIQFCWNTRLAVTNPAVSMAVCLNLPLCSGDQIVTGRSLTQGITPNVVLAQDISIPLTKTTEPFCPLSKSGGENHVYCFLMSKDGFGTATRATL